MTKPEIQPVSKTPTEFSFDIKSNDQHSKLIYYVVDGKGKLIEWGCLSIKKDKE